MASGNVTVHVLNGYHGRPGSGIEIELNRFEDNRWQHVKTVRTGASGRTEEPLLSAEEYETGLYQLVIHVGDYFAGYDDVRTTDPPYLTLVPLQLNFADPEGHYHVPVTVTPWGYTHFRGSAS